MLADLKRRAELLVAGWLKNMLEDTSSGAERAGLAWEGAAIDRAEALLAWHQTAGRELAGLGKSAESSLPSEGRPAGLPLGHDLRASLPPALQTRTASVPLPPPP